MFIHRSLDKFSNTLVYFQLLDYVAECLTQIIQKLKEFRPRSRMNGIFITIMLDCPHSTQEFLTIAKLIY